jgi:hypothetical protein
MRLPVGFLSNYLSKPHSRFPVSCVCGLTAEHLFVPIDAELTPVLLHDEATSLTARRGLVFLSRRVLEYDPDQPLSLRGLLSAERLPKTDWQPLPVLPPLAERITRLTLEGPEQTPEERLEPGGGGIGTEEPQVDPSGLSASSLGSMAVGLGRALVALGQALHIGALARAGANWIGKGLSMAPSLSKSILGAQEAALRALLREFREGNIDKALRRALPFDDKVTRGSGFAGNASLPFNNILYNLRNILAGSSGPAGYWLGGVDIWAELRTEYQKQADRAAAKGDYRRAAFIYGKLLHDFRAAANVLSRGGLHEDAAILYLKKLDDKQAAAREYEAAGNFDLALDLYRQTSRHGEAGELLRRIGEEESAVAEFHLGAEKLAGPPGNNLHAGDFLLSRAKLPELALHYFELGWRRRPEVNALTCAMRMLRIHAQQKTVEPLHGLIVEVDEHLRRTIPSDPAAEFYNEVARLAQQPMLAAREEDLRDRALVGLAHQMRERIEAKHGSTNLVSKHFGMSPIWKPDLVSDANYAVKRANRRAKLPVLRARSPLIRLPARTPKVRAVCWAPGSGDIFVGFAGDQVFVYNPRRGETKAIPFEKEPERPNTGGMSLATDMNGQVLAMLSWGYGSAATLRVYFRQMDDLVPGRVRVLRVTDRPWLCPLIIDDDDPLIGVWNGEGLSFLRADDLADIDSLEVPDPSTIRGAILMPPRSGMKHDFRALFFDPSMVQDVTSASDWSVAKNLGWSPFAPVDNSLSRQMVGWGMSGPNNLELLGVDDNGHLHQSTLTFGEDGVLTQAETQTYPKNARIRAAAFLQPGHIAAVGDHGIQWLQTGKEFRLKGMTNIRFPAAVACFPNHQGRELIVINSAGTIETVPFGAAECE